MQLLEVSGAVRSLYGLLGVKGLIYIAVTLSFLKGQYFTSYRDLVPKSGVGYTRVLISP